MNPLQQQTPREPILNLPAAVTISIVILVAIHAARLFLLADATDIQAILELAVIPARWTVALAPGTGAELIGALERAAGGGGVELAFARYILDEQAPKPWTALTYAFLHGSWSHVLLNGVWLAAFGSPIARRCGPVRYLVLMTACAVGGSLMHVAVHPLSVLPMIGASAAVSGMMAAAAWFMFSSPSWSFAGAMAEPHERPRESLPALLRNKRVLLFVGVWFAANFLFAEMAAPLGITDASIAWEAHIGGFVTGLVLFPLLDRPRRSPHS